MRVFGSAGLAAPIIAYTRSNICSVVITEITETKKTLGLSSGTALVQAALISGFEASGRIDQVAREQDALHADYDLITEIRNFEAHYPAPDAVPTVTVTLAVRLASAHGRKILGSFTATQSQPCAANSAGAVAQALGQALGQAVQAIVTWTLGATPPS